VKGMSIFQSPQIGMTFSESFYLANSLKWSLWGTKLEPPEKLIFMISIKIYNIYLNARVVILLWVIGHPWLMFEPLRWQLNTQQWGVALCWFFSRDCLHQISRYYKIQLIIALECKLIKPVYQMCVNGRYTL
jgi:hypothetical protein